MSKYSHVNTSRVDAVSLQVVRMRNYMKVHVYSTPEKEKGKKEKGKGEKKEP